MLIGTIVEHPTYGRGVVVESSEDTLDVIFSNELTSGRDKVVELPKNELTEVKRTKRKYSSLQDMKIREKRENNEKTI